MFAPGDEVECIDDEGGEFLRLGEVYTVAEFLAAGDGHDNWFTDIDAVQLVEIGHVESEDEYGFAAVCFRKIQRRNLMERLTQGVGFEEPKRVKKAVDA
jgi:hypothetical protein